MGAAVVMLGVFRDYEKVGAPLGNVKKEHPLGETKKEAFSGIHLYFQTKIIIFISNEYNHPLFYQRISTHLVH